MCYIYIFHVHGIFGENVDNDTVNSSSIQVLPSNISKNLNTNEQRVVFDLLLQKSLNGLHHNS